MKAYMFSDLFRAIGEFREMPAIAVNLMYSSAQEAAPFYADMVWKHFEETRRRHPRWPFIGRLQYGMATCCLPKHFDDYFMVLEGSARRNYKKAAREGCSARRIDFNDHLDEIREIRQSSAIRQGRLVPTEFRQGLIGRCCDPPSTSPLHDYPYFGVFVNHTLVAYAGCMVAGDICCLEQIWGHVDHFGTGVVPYLIIEIARHIYRAHEQVRFYTYGTYFGAGQTMQRFKRKLGFLPHRIHWQLDDDSQPPERRLARAQQVVPT
jgi:hypothetical protein